jgi:Holliday junction resolvasome RuvABC endonuclease subunit
MNKVIGLDISSATVGWSLFEYNDKEYTLMEYGHIKPPPSKSGSLAFRASSYMDEISKLFLEKKPDSVAIEAYASKFSPGRSSARTIIVLAVFNELTSVSSIKSIGVEPSSYAVATIRSMLSKESGTKITSKDESFDFVKNNFKKFKVRFKRTGRIKDESGDEADAIAVALTHILKGE